MGQKKDGERIQFKYFADSRGSSVKLYLAFSSVPFRLNRIRRAEAGSQRYANHIIKQGKGESQKSRLDLQQGKIQARRAGALRAARHR